MKSRHELIDELDSLEKTQVKLMDAMYVVPDDPAETMFHMERVRQELQKTNERIETINWILNENNTITNGH